METRYKPRGFPQRLGSLRLPLFPQPRRRYYLPAINLGVGPFYSIKVGSFYVVKAKNLPRLKKSTARVVPTNDDRREGLSFGPFVAHFQ